MAFLSCYTAHVLNDIGLETLMESFDIHLLAYTPLHTLSHSQTSGSTISSMRSYCYPHLPKEYHLEPFS